jgi:hypothetical protein
MKGKDVGMLLIFAVLLFATFRYMAHIAAADPTAFRSEQYRADMQTLGRYCGVHGSDLVPEFVHKLAVCVEACQPSTYGVADANQRQNIGSSPASFRATVSGIECAYHKSGM